MSDPEDSPPTPSRYGLATGVALGPLLGAAIGMLFLDNLALGAGLGLVSGIVIGAMFYLWRSTKPR